MENKFRQTAIEPLFGGVEEREVKPVVSLQPSYQGRGAPRSSTGAMWGERGPGFVKSSQAIENIREEPLPSLFHRLHFGCAAGASWVEERKAAGALHFQAWPSTGRLLTTFHL